MNVKSLREWVLIAPEPTEAISKGGIIMPPPKEERLNMGHGQLATRFKPVWGLVVCVGSGEVRVCRRTKQVTIVPAGVKLGDRVLYGRRGADHCKIGGVALDRVHQEMILCVST